MALEIPGQFNIAEYFIERPAREHPQRIAILGEPAALTYGELAVLVRRAAAALRASGCRPGDRVLIVLSDSAEFIAAFFGAAKIGAMAVPVNSMTRSPEYAYYLADSGARFAIVHASSLPEFLPGMLGHRPEALSIVGEQGEAGRISGARNWSDWLAPSSAVAESHPTSSTDTAFFLYTSGSGGTPKAAVHQHKDMLVCALSYAQGVLGIQPFDRTFSVSKLFFAYGLGNGMYFPFSVGAATVLNPERPRPEKIAELLARHRPSVFFSVPTFYNLLLREAERGLAIDFSSVRLAVSAGEALPAEIFEQFRARFGLQIVDGIGSTEMLQMFISNRPGEARPGTCGREVPNYEAVILDESGHPVQPGEIGNLWVRGLSAFAQYWNKPELTAATKDGFRVNTGDKFFRDAEGFYHYCGRSDDMMKVAGMWVSPGEVENALLGHPLVAEAAVVSSMDRSGLLRPVAYLVLRAGGNPSPQLAREILHDLRARLAAFKCPQEVHFLAELPKTATGKIQRFRLRQASPNEQP
ncbi:MAG: benzoate-CoA ligase family protein [Acidobacteria bacterium]|nr:benzoate-CoA ligase family protein [Acidobacteriota bacterium]